jgi:CDP-glucose 4,6-dehydratase
MKAEITGVALAPATNPDLFTLLDLDRHLNSQVCDICNREGVSSILRAANPEIIFHLAAQSLVHESYAAPLETFHTNIIGTANVLDVIRMLPSVRVAIIVTTDKVYRNREWVFPYREDDILGGEEPYSASKAASEIVVDSYRTTFLAPQKVAIATARAGNAIGGGDWSANRLIPDAVRAWQNGRQLLVRRPSAVRPWQHVLENVAAYLVLAEALWIEPSLAGAYNFGPSPSRVATVRTIVELARNFYGEGEVNWGDQKEGLHEAGLLSLETAKARATLKIEPRWELEEAIARTMQWYRRLSEGICAWELCLQDLINYKNSP